MCAEVVLWNVNAHTRGHWSVGRPTWSVNELDTVIVDWTGRSMGGERCQLNTDQRC